jgi:hypothetical protein
MSNRYQQQVDLGLLVSFITASLLTYTTWLFKRCIYLKKQSITTIRFWPEYLVYSWKKKLIRENSTDLLTITPSTNKIGTSSTSVSLMELALKMNFLSYNFHPWKKHEWTVECQNTFRSFQSSLLKPLGLRQHDANNDVFRHQ